MDEFEYPTHNADSIGPNNGGDMCPYCGDIINYGEKVFHWETGEKGYVLDLAEDDVSQPLLHPDCYKRALRESDNAQKTLNDFQSCS